MSTTTTPETEVAILARILDDASGRLPAELARHILDLGIGEGDRARMHERPCGTKRTS